MQRVVLRAAALVAALVCAPVAGAWTWPADGPVLQPFVFDPAHPYAAGQHRGIDVGANAGAPVLAPAGGTVSFAGSVPTSGKSVTIQIPDGYSVTLTHLGAIGVTRSAVVAEGAAVGTIGPSGTPELAEPYVHLGVRITAQEQGYLDPLAFLPARVGPSPPAPEPLAPKPAPVVVAPSAPAPAEPASVPETEQTASPPTADPVAPTPAEGTAPTLQPVDDGSNPEPAPEDPQADSGVTAESAQTAGGVDAPASSTDPTGSTSDSAEPTEGSLPADVDSDSEPQADTSVATPDAAPSPAESPEEESDPREASPGEPTATPEQLAVSEAPSLDRPDQRPPRTLLRS